VVGPVVDEIRGVAGRRRDPVARLIDANVILSDLRDGVDGYQGLRFAEAEEAAVFDQQKADLLLSVVNQ